MLDLRDAMLLADTARNPASPTSAHFCRLWESFAGRGMGISALDTADNGMNRVTAAYDVPSGCVPPPGPPIVTIVATSRGRQRIAGGGRQRHRSARRSCDRAP